MNKELKWFKSSRSTDPGPQNCVEAAVLDGEGMAIRDSKDRGGAVLQFSVTAWSTFTAAMGTSAPPPGAVRG
ncbi:DUF397 domain-containing protein [Streptomyces sp. NPDC057621]|uniref:DUF397 domain-containing protein n=1 Tax=Streptomyces sp. NPDC057621 TaxID=3346186 RepID=UPI0036A09ACD